ncbi:hypothetical protein [Mycolicibacter acidiphilus]|uniref:hypothetical protein n=1 Tax=Mycolicibacter acidiphilus TaxID=2835306 RepID=UPI002022EA8E|nr:hypothetical protein [Mycolicibacter acidiphilus]
MGSGGGFGGASWAQWAATGVNDPRVGGLVEVVVAEQGQLIVGGLFAGFGLAPGRRFYLPSGG